jgi:hypothetical protein
MTDQKPATPEQDEDICGFCNMPGADKFPHPIRWPGERSAGSEFVHAECEEEECRRAHSLLSDAQRKQFLRSI